MDNPISSTLQHSKAAKRVKSKKKSNKPIKVVYISNPMRVKTSASRFRALVQELTGQDAEFPDPTKFTDADDDGSLGGNQAVPDVAAKNDNHVQEVPRVVEQAVHHHDVPFETYDEVFTPQMLREFDRVLASEPFLMTNLDALSSL